MANWKPDTMLPDLENYWNVHAPVHEVFTPEKAAELVLFMARRYEAALCRIARESPEQKPVAMEALGVRTDDQLRRFERLTG